MAFDTRVPFEAVQRCDATAGGAVGGNVVTLKLSRRAALRLYCNCYLRPRAGGCCRCRTGVVRRAPEPHAGADGM
jgi:hypothetical protein